MLRPYRDVLSTPGAALFSAAAFVARMPMSMVTLGIVLLISSQTGSYGAAGVVSAVYMVAAAASAPVLGRLIDRLGQSRLLPWSAIIFATGIVGLVVSVHLGWPAPAPHLFAALAGISYPPIGACSRARWTHLLGKGPRLHTAYSFEAVVDEGVFITGPVLVTFLATKVDRWAGLAAVVVFALVGGLWLANLRSTQPPPTGRGARPTGSDREAFGWAGVGPLALVAVCLGSLFGATEVVTVAFATHHQRPGLSGVLLAAWSLGSLIAGAVTGTLHVGTPLRRLRVGALLLAASLLPLPFIRSMPLLGVVLFVSGFAISPTLVASMALVERTVPVARLTEGITWVSTGINLGVAPGAAIAGWVVDQHGPGAGYVVPLLAGFLGALLTLACGAGRRTAEAWPEPTADDLAGAT